MDAVPFVIESRRAPATASRAALRVPARDARASCSGARGDADPARRGQRAARQEHRTYFGDDGDGMHMMFNFWVNQHLFYALATGDVAAAGEGAASDAAAARRPRSGRTSCATTTSSISGG